MSFSRSKQSGNKQSAGILSCIYPGYVTGSAFPTKCHTDLMALAINKLVVSFFPD